MKEVIWTKAADEHKEGWKNLGFIFIVEFIKTTTKTLISMPGSIKILGVF